MVNKCYLIRNKEVLQGIYRVIRVLILALGFSMSLFGQEDKIPPRPKFYLGLSYGTSFPVLSFRSSDVTVDNAGFAKDGKKADVYAGYLLNEKWILTGGYRYQFFETDVTEAIETFNANNPGFDFSGTTQNWQVSYLLFGFAYRVDITKRFRIYPRFSLGPMMAKNPGISIEAPNSTITQNFQRSSETGFGIGYELGIGLQTNIGKHFSLMPNFAYCQGQPNIKDVAVTMDNLSTTADYQPRIQTFNLGLSLAYRFY